MTVTQHNKTISEQKVSVIVPCYNASETIRQTLTSVLNQSYANIEVIVVDDGSSDNSIDIINTEYPQVKVIRNTDGKKGVSSARNLGIKKAQGHWIAFLDADDIWLENKLEAQIDKMSGCRWSHTDSFYFGHNQTGKTKRSDLSDMASGLVFEKLLFDNFITTSTVVVERTLIIEAGMFDESFEILEDWKLWLLLAKTEPISYCDTPLTLYRISPGSTSRRAKVVYPFHKKLISDAFHLSGHSWSMGKRKALSNSNIVCSYIAEDSKDTMYALACSLRAIYFWPFYLKNWKRPLSVLLGSI